MNLNQTKQIALITLVAVLLLLSLVWEFFPTKASTTRLEEIPLKEHGMSGHVVPLTPLEQDLLGPAEAIKRIYFYEGRRYLLTVTDGTQNRHAVHDPTYCFTGAGWTITDSKPIRVPGGEGRLHQMTRAHEKASALVWFDDGERAFHGQMTYWLRTSLRRMTLGHAGDEPLLIIIRPLDARPADWDEITTGFIPLLNI